MNKITFVTSNNRKVESLRNKLPSSDFTVTQEDLDLPELQGNTAEDVSIEKAKAAFTLLKKPLIIQDSAFHIPALKGFPGPYIKYVQETLGLDGLLRLMNGKTDRSCYFEQALTYIDVTHLKTFVSDKKIGILATSVSSRESTKAWGLIWKLFIPHGFDKTLSELTEEEIRNFDDKTGIKSEFTYFIEWLLEQNRN